MNGQYHTIRTQPDIDKFQDVSNGLHDGFITHVQYNHTGVNSDEIGSCFGYFEQNLVIHILVSSLLGDPTFEISFHNILEWQIKSFYYSDITDFSILILENGYFIWADNISGNIEDLKKGSYVIAESIQYRQIL